MLKHVLTVTKTTLSGLFLVVLFSLQHLVSAGIAFGQETITEGRVTFALEYEGMGPMSAMLPKEEVLTFKQNHVRIDSGHGGFQLIDGDAGKMVSAMDFGGRKVAFRFPNGKPGGDGEESGDEGLFEFEESSETRTIGGWPARRVDVVDATDPNNRLPVWIADRIDVSHNAYAGLRGLALESIQTLNEDGERRATATLVEAVDIDDSVFDVPEDYEIFDLNSADEMMLKIQEIQPGVQVMKGE